MKSNNCVTAGLDLGTNSSVLAMLDEHSIPAAIKNAESEVATRSTVLLPPGQKPIIGNEALNAALLYPDRLAREMKMHVGEKDSEGKDVALVF
ncbi:MAG: Hsp70 family protein, partial [Anaerolineales bacterium]|nr:Hsp70 family protein [Anaerolineales bacterium]